MIKKLITPYHSIEWESDIILDMVEHGRVITFASQRLPKNRKTWPITYAYISEDGANKFIQINGPSKYAEYKVEFNSPKFISV